MNLRIWLKLAAIVFILFIGCKNDPINPDNETPFLLIDDFDDSNSVNIKGDSSLSFANLGGKISYSVVPVDPSSPPPVKGFAIKLDYDVRSQSNSHTGWGYLLQNYDTTRRFYVDPQALGLKIFSFWVKGEKGGERFVTKFADTSEKTSQELELKDALTPITTSIQWQKVSFSLEKFKKDGFNFTQLKYFLIVFFNSNTPSTGIIFIDYIAFE